MDCVIRNPKSHHLFFLYRKELVIMSTLRKNVYAYQALDFEQSYQKKVAPLDVDFIFATVLLELIENFENKSLRAKALSWPLAAFPLKTLVNTLSLFSTPKLVGSVNFSWIFLPPFRNVFIRYHVISCFETTHNKKQALWIWTALIVLRKHWAPGPLLRISLGGNKIFQYCNCRFFAVWLHICILFKTSSSPW